MVCRLNSAAIAVRFQDVSQLRVGERLGSSKVGDRGAERIFYKAFVHARVCFEASSRQLHSMRHHEVHPVSESECSQCGMLVDGNLPDEACVCAYSKPPRYDTEMAIPAVQGQSKKSGLHWPHVPGNKLKSRT